MENVTLTPKEQMRVQVLNSLLAEQIALDQAAQLMGVSTRHARRITTAYREEGAAALAHGHRGRRPVNATPAAVTAAVVRLASTRYQGANHTHLSELLAEREGHPYRPNHPATHSAGRRSEQSAPSPSTQAPGPSPADAPSGHADPAGRQLSPVVGGPQPTVHVAAGGGRRHRLCGQRLVLPAGRQPQLLPAVQNLLRRRGIPLALYTDRHAVFKHTPGSGSTGTPTQFGRAMPELGIQMIFARSPQAKGRVERAAGTFQDRLITELRLAGATTIEQAKAVLKQFLPRYNQRFQVPDPCPDPAFRPLPPDLRLGQVLCFKHKRRVARDNTVKFQRHILQLLPRQQRRSYAGAAVVVLHGLDGRLFLQHEGRIIAAQEARPSPGSMRNGIKPSSGDAPPPPQPVSGPQRPQ